MQHIIISFLILMLLTACRQERHDQPLSIDSVQLASDTIAHQAEEEPIKPVMITPGAVGNLQVGMPLEKALTTFSTAQVRRTSRTMEGQDYVVYEILGDDKQVAMEIEPVCDSACTVYRISILSPRYQTAKGVGVGTTLRELRQQYTIDYMTNETGIVIARVNAVGVSFVLDVSEVKGKVDPQALPDSLIVKQLLVTETS